MLPPQRQFFRSGRLCSSAEDSASMSADQPPPGDVLRFIPIAA
jgi:hypothetical protein